MTIKLDSLKSDLKAQKDGEWQDVNELPGLRLHVRGLNYPPYKTAREFMTRKLQREYGKKPVPDEVVQVEIGRLLAEHILLGWDGFDIEYTDEAAHDYMTRPAFGELRDYVILAAGQVGVAQVEFLEDVKGN